MKRTLIVAGSGLALIGLISFLTPGDGVSFHPGEGTKLTKSFEGEFEFALDEMTILVNGEEQDIGMDEEPAGTASYSIVVTDHFRSMEDGRPTDLMRTFVEISGATESSDGDSSEGSLDDLEGNVVRFAWDDEEGAYTVSFEEGGGDEEALALLTPDMDFRALLPRGEVDEGDEWELEGENLFKILIPGVDVRNAADSGLEIDGQEIPEALADLLEEFLDNVSATCTYKGSADEDGVEVGEIAFTVEISGSMDIDPSAFGEQAMDFGGDAEISLNFDIEMEGTLLWNLRAGHFHTFTMEGEGVVDMEMSMSIPDFDMEFENMMSVSLIMEQAASAEAAE